MILIFWFLAYFASLLLEVSILPVFGTAWLPAVSTAFLIAGVALQDFYRAFWFAGLAGLAADFFVLPDFLISHTVLAFTIFFAVSFFKAVAHLDEPLYTVASLVVGFLALPLSRFSGAVIAKIFFQRSTISFPHFFPPDRLLLSEAFYSIFFVAVFSWFFIRRFSKRRSTRLSRL